MSFLGVYRATYDYTPRAEGELALNDGDLLFILEKSTTDDWWKAKKKAASDEEDEPEGLIPNNFVEEAKVLHTAKALYDYASQTAEELSLTEDDHVDVYDVSDADWTLVGHSAQYGFAPAAYLEQIEDESSVRHVTPDPSDPTPSFIPPMPVNEPSPEPTPEPESPPIQPAKALAGIIAQRTGQSQTAPQPPAQISALPSRNVSYSPQESDEEVPIPPPKDPPPQQQQLQLPARIPQTRQDDRRPSQLLTSPISADHETATRSPGGYQLYNVHEMVSHNSKNKKMPTVLGINTARGLMSITPAKSRDGAQQEWTAEKLTHYSIEGKHVFMELIRPSRSIDFHAGAKDTAREIVAGLGEIAGAARAGGLREVIAATTGHSRTKKGHMLYEFMAQGDDEVTVAVGDEIIVLDDTKSEEWWMVRRLRNGKEGVVPSSYVEITGVIPPPSSSYLGANAGKSVVEQNRLEEERITRHAAQSHGRQGSDTTRQEVGNETQSPRRYRNVSQDVDQGSSQKSRSSRHADKPKPNRAKIRIWTDRSGSFKVEAEFIGLKDGKIHLHKTNGVKIAVPVNKMAVEDLEYVEDTTGVSLDEDKPLSDIKRRSTITRRPDDTPKSTVGAQVKQCDWFDFFLAAGVNPQICERYANAFNKDQMGEEILPDVSPQLLRTLGLKEGDIIRVMKMLDAKYNRSRAVTNGKAADEAEPASATSNTSGGLFSGPGGALRNNTRKGRPAPAVQTNDAVNGDALKLTTNGANGAQNSASSAVVTSGFDDNAWDVKPAATAQSAPTSAVQPARSYNVMDDLSMLAPALTPGPAPAPTPGPPAAATQDVTLSKPSADPAFFDKLGAPASAQILQPQSTGRARPLVPQQTSNMSTIAPPPRTASAPVSAAGGISMQMQPQATGYQIAQQTGFQAPPGQSLQAIQQQQAQQQASMQPQMTGYMGQPNGMLPQPTAMPQNMPVTMYAQSQAMQPQFLTGQMTGSPFADPPRAPFQAQQTGFQQNSFTAGQTPGFFGMPQQTGGVIGMPPQQTNGVLGMPPQQTGGVFGPAVQPQQTGFIGMNNPTNGFGSTSGFGMGAQQTGVQQAPPQTQNQFAQQMMPPQQTGGVFTPGNTFSGAAPLVPQRTGPAPNVRFGVGAPKLVAQATGRRANLSNATPQNPFGF